MLFSSKLRLFDPPKAFFTTKKAWIEMTPNKDRKRTKDRGIRVKNHVKDDPKNHFKDDLAFSKS